MFDFCSEDYTTHRALLDADAREFEKEWRESYEKQHPRLYALLNWVATIKMMIWYRYCIVWAGHDMVDTSHGGPDSGDMSGYCRRCGWSYFHRLY